MFLPFLGGTCWAEQWSESDGLHIVIANQWTKDDNHETSSAGTVILQRRNPAGSVALQVVKSEVHRGFAGLEKKGLIEGLSKSGLTLTSYQEAHDIHGPRLVMLATHAASGLILSVHFLWNDRALYKVTYACKATVDPAEWNNIAASETIDARESATPPDASTDGHAWSVNMISIGIWILMAALVVALMMKRR